MVAVFGLGTADVASVTANGLCPRGPGGPPRVRTRPLRNPGWSVVEVRRRSAAPEGGPPWVAVCAGWGLSNCRANCGAQAPRAPCAPQLACHRETPGCRPRGPGWVPGVWRKACPCARVPCVPAGHGRNMEPQRVLGSAAVLPRDAGPSLLSSFSSSAARLSTNSRQPMTTANVPPGTSTRM
jgi:hypothetical protein